MIYMCLENLFKKENLKTGSVDWCDRFHSAFIFSSRSRRKSVSNKLCSSAFDKIRIYCGFQTLLRMD